MKVTRHLAASVLVLFLSGEGLADPRETASRLFLKLTGTPLSLKDSRRTGMEQAIDAGDLASAARVATEDSAFYNVTIRHWGGTFGNRSESPLVPLNDSTAMVIGTVRDEKDFREILTGDFGYAASGTGLGSGSVRRSPINNQHYENLETEVADLRKQLVRYEPQQDGILDAAGILTSRAWGEAHLTAGTNRRAVEFAFRQFLCTPLADMRDSTLLDTRVHRDVDRSPGGNSQTYTDSCRGCHAGMDSLVGAFAYFTFEGSNGLPIGGLSYLGRPARKMNQNGNVYLDGYFTFDNSWKNLFTQNHNARLGWRGTLEGKGVREFGNMLANSQAFSQCMVKRTFKQICHREFEPSEEKTLAALVTQFESGGYNVRRLFEQTAILPTCL